MKGKGMILALVLSLAVNLAAAATVGYHYISRPAKVTTPLCTRISPDKHLFQFLGLTPRQLSQVEPLAHTFHERLKVLTTAVEEHRRLLIEMLGQDQPEAARLETTHRELAKQQEEIQKEVVAHIIQIKQILTPEQKTKFIQLLRQNMEGTEQPWVGGK